MKILAVSGGVDSMVMLHIAAKSQSLDDIVVAHFDHGIRKDSHKDAALIKKICINLGIKLELGRVELGQDASEEQARNARLAFLHAIKSKYSADKILTAHHQDDVIETAVINLLRGTGRRGLSSLKNTVDFERPLLNMTKLEILEYAKSNNIFWNEDSTNSDLKYLRNRVRLKLMPQAIKQDPDFKDKMLEHIDEVKSLNAQCDELLSEVINACYQEGKIDRSSLKSLEKDLIKEITLQIARDKYGELYLSRERLEEFVDFVKNKQTGKTFEFNGRLSVKTYRDFVEFVYSPSTT